MNRAQRREAYREASRARARETGATRRRLDRAIRRLKVGVGPTDAKLRHVRNAMTAAGFRVLPPETAPVDFDIHVEDEPLDAVIL